MSPIDYAKDRNKMTRFMAVLRLSRLKGRCYYSSCPPGSLQESLEKVRQDKQVRGSLGYLTVLTVIDFRRPPLHASLLVAVTL